MLKATAVSFAIMVASMFTFAIVNIGLHLRGRQTQLGLGALLNYTVLNPFLWFLAVAVFFLAFRYFVRHQDV
jgi:hypothetical protein